jgi:hypothetical protein
MQADFSVELGPDDPVLELPWASEDPSVRYYELRRYPELVGQIPEAVAYPVLGAFLTRINAPTSPLETAKCDVWQSREMLPEEEIFGAGQKFVSYIDLVFVDEALRGSFEKHEDFAKTMCRLLSHAPDMLATIELIIRRGYFHERRSVAHGEGCQTTDIEQGGAAFQPLSRISEAGIGNAKTFHRNIYPFLKNSTAGPYCEAGPDSDGNGDPIVLSNGFYFTVYVIGFGNSDSESQHNWEIIIALLQHALMQKIHN